MLNTVIALDRLGMCEPYTDADVRDALEKKKASATALRVVMLEEAANFLIDKPAPLLAEPQVEGARQPRASQPEKTARGVRKKPRRRKDASLRKAKPEIPEPRAAFQAESNVKVPGINAAPHEFLLEGRNYTTKPRLLVEIKPGDVFLVDIFRNSCRWHPSDVPLRLRGTFKTPNQAGEVLLNTLSPSARITTRRTASARSSFFFAGCTARSLIDRKAKLVDLLAEQGSAPMP